MFTQQVKTSTPASFSNIMIFASILTVSCVTLALPVSNAASSKHDLNNLMSLLGKLKDAQRIRHNVLDSASSSSSSSSSNHRAGKVSSLDDAAILLQRAAAAADNFDSDDDDVEETDASSDRMMNKRQGAWSFDYGLGGGRFGKRGYGYPEYGLGGGRFGRDTDHVDPNHDIDVDVDSVDDL